MSGIEHLLDTNVIIGLLKGNGPAIELAQTSGLSLSNAAVSQITRLELLGYPHLNDAEEQAILAFLTPCQVIGIDAAVEAHAIRLRRAGLLKLPDAIVAGTALATGAQLLTLDQRLLNVLAQDRGA